MTEVNGSGIDGDYSSRDMSHVRFEEA